MKKLYLIATAFVISLTAMAQSNSNAFEAPQTIKYQMKSSPKFNRSQANRSSNGLYINYDSAESYNTATLNGLPYQTNYIKNMNMNYSWPADSLTAGSDPIRYGVVAVDSLFDPYSYTSYTNASSSDIRVDSIFIIVGQQNLSGNPDTLVTNIVSVDPLTGYPTNTVLWTDMTIIPPTASLSLVSSGTNSWLQGAIHTLNPNYIVMGASRFAIQVKYYGNKLDTFGMQYGFPYFSAGCGAQAGPFKLATPTVFTSMPTAGVANSFAYHINRGLGGAALTGKLFPTNTGGYVYYNCDGVAGYTAGVDGKDYMQDFSLITYVTTNPLGIMENVNKDFSLGQNEPNPFTNHTKINYTLKKSASNVAVQIYDIRGVKIYEKAEKNLKSGNYSVEVNDFNFASGMYFCTLVVDGERVTNKMVKQ